MFAPTASISCCEMSEDERASIFDASHFTLDCQSHIKDKHVFSGDVIVDSGEDLPYETMLFGATRQVQTSDPPQESARRPRLSLQSSASHVGSSWKTSNLDSEQPEGGS